MAILQGNAKQGSTRGFYPRVINGSLRFNDDDSAYLSWTPDSAGNRKTWTISFWFKRGNLSNANQTLFIANVDASNYSVIQLQSNDVLFWDNRITTDTNKQSTQVFRDPSAWYHLVIKCDTTQATPADRLRIYINGSEITSWTNSNYPAQNADTYVNSTTQHRLGAYSSGTQHFDGYMAEVHFTDGTAYDADAFGEFKNGVWVAKTPDVTYGTNGFYLTFEDDTEVEAFNTVLYRGDGSTGQSITGTGFSPDLVWIKQRDGTPSHAIFDTVRGADNVLRTNGTDAENATAISTADYGGLTSFDADGFTVDDGTNTTFDATNGSGDSYVAWCWKAGDSNVSNTDGSITSTVRANDTYGFSIVSYTGNATNSTIGHGLSTTPDLIIVKNRETGGTSWRVYHSSLTSASYYLMLDDTTGELSGTYWNNTAPTSSVFSLGTGSDVNQNGIGHIAYCWAEKTGYSKFGSYTSDTGNVSITTGFKPAFLLIKSSSNASQWEIIDNTRDTVSPHTKGLRANNSNAEFDYVSTLGQPYIDFTDTGFTITGQGDTTNLNGWTFIYAAFADTREAAFWLDQSGNDNDWQPVNLDHNDTVADSPTDNFATLNPILPTPNGSLADGNLKFNGAGGWGGSKSTIGIPSTGKWYAEFTLGTTSSNSAQADIGIFPDGNSNGYSWTGSYGLEVNNGFFLLTNGSYSSNRGGTTAAGTVFQISVDADSGKVWFGVDNAWYDTYNTTNGDPSAGTNPSASGLDFTSTLYFMGVKTDYNNWTANFGQQPFKYDPPV